MRANIKNPAAYPLLEGRVRSYRNGSYVGDSRLRHQGVGAPFEISLGIDEYELAEVIPVRGPHVREYICRPRK